MAPVSVHGDWDSARFMPCLDHEIKAIVAVRCTRNPSNVWLCYRPAPDYLAASCTPLCLRIHFVALAPYIFVCVRHYFCFAFLDLLCSLYYGRGT